MKQEENQEETKLLDVISVPKRDRRLLPHVPDPEGNRSPADRRGAKGIPADAKESFKRQQERLSIRYEADFDVVIIGNRRKKKHALQGKAVDISSTGILVALESDEEHYIVGQRAGLRFRIPPGTMPEPFESAVKMEAALVRMFTREQDGQKQLMLAFEFTRPLTEYFRRKRWGMSAFTVVGAVFAVACLTMLMRMENVIYYRYNLILYLYSLLAAVFLISRYLFGALYREVPVDPQYTPGVSIVIHGLTEEKWIERTILSCVDQDYPVDKLEIIIVADQASAEAVERVQAVIARIHHEGARFFTKERMSLRFMPENEGRRAALAEGAAHAKHKLVATVDAGSFLEPAAIRRLVQPFQDPQVGGVSGRMDVENKFTNSITMLQAVRYHSSFRIAKAAESKFDSVTSLSGSLSCYRKELILQYMDSGRNLKYTGQPGIIGDNRSLTNFVLRTHRTAYQDSAVCSVFVPSEKRALLMERMHAKRAWLRGSLRAGTFIWRKEPFMALFFYIGLLIAVTAPVIVVDYLVYEPIAHHFFPSGYLLGLLVMLLIMGLAHLLLRKSRLWLFGLIRCLFTELALLWQMPVAWVTCWKSPGGASGMPQLKAAEVSEHVNITVPETNHN
ncbi:glycosyltransferase [Paenibacillus sp. R14(2021)]|uniref:glycosyltransferase family 2 protein n=1 Tax=Paenibacillus sp. R14(2021) TaxID=2859228 RepID=UPI002157C12B|nr:glycosyltransferase [Paenibacillus sp. R14(2021)]